MKRMGNLEVRSIIRFIRSISVANWEGVQGLETAVNVPDALKRQLGMAVAADGNG